MHEDVFDAVRFVFCGTDRSVSDAIDALFLCQSGIKGSKAEDEINSAIYSFAFKVMMMMESNRDNKGEVDVKFLSFL